MLAPQFSHFSSVFSDSHRGLFNKRLSILMPCRACPVESRPTFVNCVCAECPGCTGHHCRPCLATSRIALHCRPASRMGIGVAKSAKHDAANADGFDYIVVGAGSAGSLLAARLAEGGKHTVCVLEAGPARPQPVHPYSLQAISRRSITRPIHGSSKPNRCRA